MELSFDRNSTVVCLRGNVDGSRRSEARGAFGRRPLIRPPRCAIRNLARGQQSARTTIAEVTAELPAAQENIALTPSLLFQPNADSIQEVGYQTSNYAPEFGQARKRAHQHDNEDLDAG